MNSFDTKIQRCPKCGYLLDACTAITGQSGPKVGDVTVCIECHAVLEWDEEMMYREIEASTLPAEIQKVLATVIGTLAAVKMPDR